jgi:predicted nucleic acid-binding protein
MAIEKKTHIRVYADTSVFGGVFDEEFDLASRSFFKEVQEKKFVLITSELVREEILAAPQKVQKYFEKMLAYCEIAEIQADALELQAAYLKEEIVSDKYSTDALHVALATAANAKMIISWNFKHIVNYQKIPLYNAVNRLKGYDPIDIYSPLEVIENENENV